MPFQAPQSEKCQICQKSVYAQERQEAGGKVYHKACFKCVKCKKSLNLQNYFQADGVIYCQNHYQDCVLAKNSQVVA